MSLIKRIKSAFVAVIVTSLFWASPVLAAGTTPLSLVQQFDSTGAPLAGCLLYFYTAGTVATPQNAYADFALTQQLPNPVTCDQSGRVPQHWLADGLIHIRLTDASGVVQVDTTMQVLGPSSGGGGGGSTVDPTTILSSGDLKVKYGTGPLTGFVRANGLTIGNAVSGATERANADTQNLYVYLWGADPNLVVVGGRGATALADFNANKQLTLPDYRGRALAALDDMGNTAAGRLTSTYFGTSATVLGAAGGAQSHTLLAAELPSDIPYTDPGHTHGVSFRLGDNTGAGTLPYGGSVDNSTFSATTVSTSTTGITINPSGNAAHAIVSPMILATVYIKL